MEHDKNHRYDRRENWSSQMIEAYRATADEYVWLKPATWIAAFTLVFTLGSAIFWWGRSTTQTVTQDQLKSAIQIIPTRQEMKSELENKASREDMLKLQNSIELLKRDMEFLKERQIQGFQQITKRLDSFFDTGEKTEKKRK